MKKRSFKSGTIEGSTVAIAILALFLIGAGAFGIWSYVNYREAQTNLDGKVDLAVAEAEKKQADIDEAKFAEREKTPNREFSGPADFGHVTFMHPKTWSAYIANDGSDGKNYQAYLNPGVVPPVPTSTKIQQRFALRVFIYESSMEIVLKEFEKTITAGELSSSPVIMNGKSGTKITGSFPSVNKNDDRIRGSAVYFKVNDKTLMIRTDAETFNSDFNNILNTIKFD